MELHGIVCYEIALHGILWHCVLLNDIEWYCKFGNGIVKTVEAVETVEANTNRQCDYIASQVPRADPLPDYYIAGSGPDTQAI